MLENLSVGELLLAREWLNKWMNSMSIKSKYIHSASTMKTEVDKLLWSKLISSDTPWGETFDKGK